MKKIYLFVLFGLVAAPALSQRVKVIEWHQMNDLMSKNEGKTTVINFWATWCAPCIKELPYFEAIHKESSNTIEVNLISLDFVEQLDKVQRFVDKKGLQSQVFLLDNIDYDSWISKVDENWSGAIPATLIINEQSGDRLFVEGEISQEQLTQLINKIKTNP